MKARKLGDIIAEQLIAHIQEQGYKPGDKLPNEYELAKYLNVSRNTMRESLRVLASRNIVDIRQGAGTFISHKKGLVKDPLGFSFAEDRAKLVEDLIQIRCIIEPPIAALAAQNATRKNIEILKGLCDEIEELIKKRKSFTEKDLEFHTHLAICSNNQVMSQLVPVIGEGITLFSSMVSEQEYEQTLISHREIYKAVKEGRSKEAEQAMLFHLLYNKNRFFDGK